ncbi:Uncharacterised protein [Mycobacteroides abscessus subsp. massiliense]|nr:Uncharacterised protein [Mycobacteroides abscessus subsp. massiliense]
MIGLDVQRVDGELTRLEMAIRCVVPPRRLDALGRVIAIVIAHRVVGQICDTQRNQQGRNRDHRRRPLGDSRTQLAPGRTGLGRLRQPGHLATQCQQCRTQRERRDHGDNHRHETRWPQGPEVVQSRQAQAQARTGYRDARPQHNVGHTAHRGVVRGLAVLSGTPGLLKAAEIENAVIGGHTENQRHRHIHGERRDADDVVFDKQRDHAASSGQRDQHTEQRNDRPGDRAICDQQHRDDHDDGDDGQRDHALVGGVERVRGQGRRAAHVDRESLGLVLIELLDDAADGLDGPVRVSVAQIAGGPHCQRCGLRVRALLARPGDGVTPQVHQRLHVLFVVQ